VIWDGIYIAGTGGWLPARVDVATAIARGEVDGAFNSFSQFRAITVEPTVPAPMMAARAALTALQHAGARPAELQLIVYAAVSEQAHLVPASYVQRFLGAREALAFEIRQASNGMIAGLTVAAGQLSALPDVATALVASADRFSAPRWDRWQSIASLFLADAGAAIVLSKQPGFARLLSTGYASEADMEGLARASDWERQPAASQHSGKLDSSIETMQRISLAATREALTAAGLTIADIGHVLLPAFGRALLDFILEPYGIDLKRTNWSYARNIGHAGACDIVLGLDHLYRGGELRPGEYVLLAGIGAGHNATSHVLQIM
jgi:3-oxoacyl-[acyl-carrier-protein] synthase III